MEKSKSKNFMQTLKETLTDYIQHPKKLLPTIILTVVWIAFSLMSALGANIPFLRFLYTLTYANGGMFGGFFGAVGGIFGKAVFAAVVNVFVLSICAKKNPFKGIKAGLKNSVGGGVKAVSPFLIGGGAGILLYWFFNMTSSVQNCAISIACVLAGLQALSSKNSILVSAIFWLLGKISKGKAPSKTTANRILAGLTAGFAISFPITFIQLPVLIVILGALLIAAGIIIPFAMNKKTVAASLLVLLSFSVFGTTVSAEGGSLPSGFTDPAKIDNFNISNVDSQLSSYDQFYLEPEAVTSGFLDDFLGDSTFRYSGISRDSEIILNASPVTLDRNKTDGSYQFTGGFSCSQAGHKGDLLDYSMYTYTIDYSLDCTISNIRFDYNRVIADYSGTETITYSTDVEGGKSGTETNIISGTSTGDNCKWKTTDGTSYLTLYSPSENYQHVGIKFVLAGLYAADGSTGKTDDTDDTDDTGDTDEVEYVPYRGRLTYTSGRTNKNGQPFPDLMDFDGDGEMTWLDVAIQKELSHDPDYLDRPESKAAGVLIGVLTAIFGAAAGAVAGAIGGAAGGIAGGAAGSAASVLGGSEGVLENIEISTSEDDLGPYITRDSDGDLNVTDPATGENRLYKANGDGTYTNPLTGATYTEAELKSSLESRAENADLINQDEAVRQAATDKQREDNQEKSDYAKKVEAENAAARARDAYVDKLKDKYSVTSEEKLRDTIAKEQGKAEIESYDQLADEQAYKGSQEYCETVEKTSDIAIDVLAEVTGEEGKAIKDAYTFAKSTMVRGSEAFAEGKSVTKGMIHGAIEGAVGVVQNRADSPTKKLAANVGGDVFKVALDATTKGEKIDALKVTEAAASAALNTGVDVGMDMAGDFVKEAADLGDNVVKNVLKTDVTSKAAADAAKTFIADVAKDTAGDAVQIPSEDEEAVYQKFVEERNEREESANKQAAEQFREAQKQWAEKKNGGSDNT